MARAAFGNIPIIIGGTEASLRRFAHYDYWQDKVRRSILVDSGADLLLFGMGERTILTVAEKLSDGNIKLDIGTVSVIRKYKDANKLDAGFIYNINPGQSFKVATSFVEDSAPIFDEIRDNLTVSAKSLIEVTLNASSEISDNITYVGTSLPRGASVDEQSGKVTWIPDSAQVGDNLFTVTAYDAEGRLVSVDLDSKAISKVGAGFEAEGTYADGTYKLMIMNSSLVPYIDAIFFVCFQDSIHTLVSAYICHHLHVVVVL